MQRKDQIAYLIRPRYQDTHGISPSNKAPRVYTTSAGSAAKRRRHGMVRMFSSGYPTPSCEKFRFIGWTLSWKVPEHEPEQATELSAELRVLLARALALALLLLLLPAPRRNLQG